MLTELETYPGVFDNQHQHAYVPCTIDEIANAEELTVENFFEIPGITEKIDDTLNFNESNISNTESHDHSSMTSSPVDDLLNLDDFQDGSWRVDYTRSDPDWSPETFTVESVLASTSKTNINNNSDNNVQPKRASKRQSTSSSESEILIEIEESSKRAKRCTAQLTEEQKRLRRKELNRLAAQRCRNKRRGHADILEQEITELTQKNKELRERLEELNNTKDELYDIIKFHFSNCHGKASSSS